MHLKAYNHEGIVLIIETLKILTILIYLQTILTDITHNCHKTD